MVSVWCGCGRERGAGWNRQWWDRPPPAQLRSLWTRVHWGLLWGLSPLHPSRSVGTGPAVGTPDVLSLRAATSVPARSLSGQLCDCSPASAQDGAVLTWRVIRNNCDWDSGVLVWEELLYVGFPVPPFSLGTRFFPSFSRCFKASSQTQDPAPIA